MVARLDFWNIPNSLTILDTWHESTGFNDKDKYCMLKKAATENYRLAELPLIKGPDSYCSQTKSFEEIVKSTNTFQLLNQDSECTGFIALEVNPYSFWKRSDSSNRVVVSMLSPSASPTERSGFISFT